MKTADEVVKANILSSEALVNDTLTQGDGGVIHPTSCRVEQELRENLDLGFLGAKLSRSKQKLEEKSATNLARF